MPSGQSLLNEDWELSVLGGMVGTSDFVPSTELDGWATHLLNVARDAYIIKKHHCVYRSALRVHQHDNPSRGLNQNGVDKFYAELARDSSHFLTLGHVRAEAPQIAVQMGENNWVVAYLEPAFDPERPQLNVWVDRMIKLMEVPERAVSTEDIAKVISEIEDQMVARNFENISSLFTHVSPKSSPIAFLLAALRITFVLRKEILGWSEFRDRVEVEIRYNGLDSGKLLRGLTG